jgi:dolichol-phosphate mannosyltransferase
VSVVLPTRHEAGTIGAFLARTLRALEGIPAEVVVVDDSDRDDTAGVLLRLRERLGLGEALVVRHRPAGSVPERTLGTAVVDGLRAARGAYVCVLDGDGQHPPEAIPALLAAARRDGADYVGASRSLPGGGAAGLDARLRKLVSRGLAWVARAAFAGTPVRRLTDPPSGLFLFRRGLVAGVDLRPVGRKISLEVLVRSGARRPAEVPYAFAPRAGGDSKATVAQGLPVLRHLVSVRLRCQMRLWGLGPLGRPGVRRALCFGAVGTSGLAVNTGTVLALAALGFDGLSWPLWLASELSVLWNYHLHRRLTWRDRPGGTWWAYNLNAGLTGLVGIAVTRGLGQQAHAPLWLASLGGVAAGGVLSYLLADAVVFGRLARRRARPGPAGAGAAAPAGLAA